MAFKGAWRSRRDCAATLSAAAQSRLPDASRVVELGWLRREPKLKLLPKINALWNFKIDLALPSVALASMAGVVG